MPSAHPVPQFLFPDSKPRGPASGGAQQKATPTAARAGAAAGAGQASSTQQQQQLVDAGPDSKPGSTLFPPANKRAHAKGGTELAPGFGKVACCCCCCSCSYLASALPRHSPFPCKFIHSIPSLPFPFQARHTPRLRHFFRCTKKREKPRGKAKAETMANVWHPCLPERTCPTTAAQQLWGPALELPRHCAQRALAPLLPQSSRRISQSQPSPRMAPLPSP